MLLGLYHLPKVVAEGSVPRFAMSTRDDAAMMETAAAAAALAATNANEMDDEGDEDSNGADDLAQPLSNIPMPSATPPASASTPVTYAPAMARGAKRGADESGMISA